MSRAYRLRCHFDKLSLVELSFLTSALIDKFEGYFQRTAFFDAGCVHLDIIFGHLILTPLHTLPFTDLLDCDIGVNAEVSAAVLRHIEGDSQHECIQRDELPAGRTLDSREDLIQGSFMEIPDVLAELILPVI